MDPNTSSELEISDIATDKNSVDGFLMESRNQHNKFLKNHLMRIKWIGLLLILLSTSVIPGIYFVHPTFTTQDFSPENSFINNQTACVYIKKYHLQYDTYVHVCNLEGFIFLDIRKFINETATAMGIQLNLQQWQLLKQLVSRKDIGVSEARTYWNELKTFTVQREDGKQQQQQ